jgi:hypothetical protein
VDSHRQTIWIADAHRDDGKRFVARAGEKLTAFLELEPATRGLQPSHLWWIRITIKGVKRHMKQHEVTVPQIGLIAGTRAMLGAGIALLLSEKLSGEQRRAIGWTLVAVGALTTIPLVLQLFSEDEWSRRGPLVHADEELSAFLELERQMLTVTYLESIQADS